MWPHPTCATYCSATVTICRRFWHEDMPDLAHIWKTHGARMAKALRTCFTPCTARQSRSCKTRHRKVPAGYAAPYMTMSSADALLQSWRDTYISSDAALASATLVAGAATTRSCVRTRVARRLWCASLLQSAAAWKACSASHATLSC